MIAYFDEDEAFTTHGESRMMPHLVSLLRRKRWIRPDTKLARELPLNGRRVDLAVCTRTLSTSSFELKLGGFNRVLEQAHYNRYSFTRSWIVVAGAPRAANIKEAARFGIGIIVISNDVAQVVLRASPAIVRPEAHQRVVRKFELVED